MHTKEISLSDRRSAHVLVGIVSALVLLVAWGAGRAEAGTPPKHAVELALIIDRLTDEESYTEEQREIFWEKRYRGSSLATRGVLKRLTRNSLELHVANATTGHLLIDPMGFVSDAIGKLYYVVVKAQFKQPLSDDGMMSYKLGEECAISGALSDVAISSEVRQIFAPYIFVDVKQEDASVSKPQRDQRQR